MWPESRYQGDHKGCPYITPLPWSQGKGKVVPTWCGRDARAPILPTGFGHIRMSCTDGGELWYTVTIVGSCFRSWEAASVSSSEL